MPKESPVSTCLSTFVISYLPYDNHPNKHEVIPQGGFLFFFMFFVWLHRVLVEACRVFVASCEVFVEAHGPCSCGGQAQWSLVSCGNSVPRPSDQTCLPCIAGWVLIHWTTREVPRCGSDLRFPDVAFPFIYLLAIRVSSSGTCVFRSLTQF